MSMDFNCFSDPHRSNDRGSSDVDPGSSRPAPQVDEEQVRHAMADPEIQQILHARELSIAARSCFFRLLFGQVDLLFTGF